MTQGHDKKQTPPPLVSVVMATHQDDDASLLRQAIASILGQTYPRLELLVVLDGPVDLDTRDFLEDLSVEDTRVRIVPRTRNGGPGAARNSGIAEARGVLIAIADADDVSHPDRIKAQAAFLSGTRASLAGSFVRYIGPDGEALGGKQMPLTPSDIKASAIWFSPMNNPSVMGYAKVFKRNPYREDYRVAEDYELWVRLLKRGYVLRNQAEYLCDMHIQPEFWRKRGGWRPFINDLSVRLRAVSLYPLLQRPRAFLLAWVLSGTRLLPSRFLQRIYQRRNSMHYS